MSIVLIVGAASDIGCALARTYAAAGHPLVLAARQVGRLERHAQDLRIRHGVSVELVEFDILTMERHSALLDGLSDLPQIVISVVGLLGDQAAAECDAVAAELIMRTNYLAPALFLAETAERMSRRGNGTIIGISSVAGERGRASNYVYGSAKAGFTQFLSGLRNRLAGKGIGVLTVLPGFVDTRMTEGLDLPARLTAQPDEVARAIFSAARRNKDVLYVKPVWRLIMLVIKVLPEALFKRTRL